MLSTSAIRSCSFLIRAMALSAFPFLRIKLRQHHRAAHSQGRFQFSAGKFFQRGDRLVDFARFLAGGGAKEKRLFAVTRIFFQRAKLG